MGQSKHIDPKNIANKTDTSISILFIYDFGKFVQLEA